MAAFAHKLINGTALASATRLRVAAQARELGAAGWAPRLLSIVFQEEGSEALDSAIGWYVRNQRRVAGKCGIEFEERRVPYGISSAGFVEVLERANQDPRITGVVMQRPFPEHLSADEIQTAIHPLKDVEGMHESSIGAVVYNETEMVPCTAKAAVACLKSTSLATGPERSLRGLTCVVVGHSEIVGKPISFLLMNEGAIVTTCHHMTRDLAVHTRKADAVFVAVGKAGLIRGDMLKPGAALIDVGINPVKDENGQDAIVGDADMESCLPVVGWVTPVPGGVGPVTTAALMENTVLAAQAQRRHYEAVFGPKHSSSNSYMFTQYSS